MVRKLSVESSPRAIPEDVRAFAVIRGGKGRVAERTAEPDNAAATGPLAAEDVPVHEPVQPNAVYPHASFERALRGLLEDIRRRDAPIIVLTGEAGIGKTTLVDCALRELGEDTDTLLFAHPPVSFDEFLSATCQQLGLAEAGADDPIAADEAFDRLWDHLQVQLVRRRHLVVFLDNAQEMSEALLGEFALLSKWMELEKQVLQVVLVGLPGFRAVVQRLVRHELISDDHPTHCILPLEPDEIRELARALLSAAGTDATPVVVQEALDRIAIYAQGIPRLVVTLCWLAVFAARRERQSVITDDFIDQVVQNAMANGQMHQVEELDVNEENEENEEPADLPHDELVLPDLEIATLESRCLEIPAVDTPAGDTPAVDTNSRPLSHSVPSSNTRHEEVQRTRFDELTQILKNLQNRSPGIEATALISEDGLMIASAFSSDLDDTRVGGMTATLLSLGTRAAVELRRGEVKEVIVRDDDGYAVMVSAGRGTLLLVLTTEDTKLGLIFFDMREAIKSIGKVL
ncbi:MAG: AAA family ATPase [Propionivibrio sp.]